MHVLVIGSGGREHALGWKIAQSPLLSRLSAAPGNPGLEELGRCFPIDPMNAAGVIGLCKSEKIDFVVVGPEAPLAAGLVDALDAAGIVAFGPTKAAAQVEASKAFAKQLCDEAGIPTAAYGRFEKSAEAKAFLARFSAPYVIKADGLAAGKGVVIAETQGEAERAIDSMMKGAFGEAGRTIVIEEYLAGEEASYFALSDGETALPMIGVQDHKRAFDGDRGPNTGGMGAYAPAPAFTAEIARATLQRIVQPALARLKERGTPYRGVLFAGLMLTKDGPKLIEFNARFGDPECQVLMLLLKSDLLPALLACARGGLERIHLDWHEGAALTVVMAARGYPGTPEKGSVIAGLGAAASVPDVHIFHAGTSRRGGKLVANGGRVLNIAARAGSLQEARARAYEAIARIDWPGGFYRRDIGRRALGQT